MIDFIILAWQLGLPYVGGFAGALSASYFWCPNRGCCQARKIKEVIEGGR